MLVQSMPYPANSAPPLPFANPNHYRTAILIDATGQANGTGYSVEESRNAWALTYGGSAAIASGKFEFNGTTDFMTVPHTLLWTPGSKFTMGVLGLVFDAVNTGTNQSIASHYNPDSSANQDRSWFLEEAGGQLRLTYSTDGLTTSFVTIGTVAAGVSYDVAIAWDGQTIYTLLNGVQGGAAAFSGNFRDSKQVLRFGCSVSFATNVQFLDGRFSAFFYTRGETLFASAGAYTMPSLPVALDNPALTDSSWGSVLALIGYDATISRIRDFGPYDLPLSVVSGAAGDTGNQLADGTPSISFNGTSGYISIVDDPLLELGSSDVTIECFARHTATNQNNQYVTKYQSSSSQRVYAFSYRGDTASGLQTLLSTGGGSPTIISAAHVPTVGSFFHAAVCRSGSNWRHFADGVQKGSTATFSGSLFNNGVATRIGTFDSGGLTGFMNGNLSQIRLTKAARYTANFTAPTGALPVG
jgi:hypothetical protein